MPINHQWIIPKRLFYVQWEGVLSIADLQEANRNTEKFLLAGDEPIHMLRDDSALTEMPPITIRQVLDTLHAAKDPRLGWVVTMGRSHPIAHGLTELYVKFARIQLRRVTTLDEAFSFLKQVDSSLDFSQLSADFQRS